VNVLDAIVLDAIVLGALALGAVLGFVSGFVRGGLFVASWVGAVFAALYGFPFAQPYARDYISPDWAADIAAGAGIFIVSLVVLHVVSHMIAAQIRHSALNALDRSLGLVAGAVATAAVICVAYLTTSDFLPVEEQPEWVRSARITPYVARGALVVRDLAPPELRSRTGKRLEQGIEALDTLESTLPAVEQLLQPPNTTAPAPEPGYNEADRQQLDQAIESTQ